MRRTLIILCSCLLFSFSPLDSLPFYPTGTSIEIDSFESDSFYSELAKEEEINRQLQNLTDFLNELGFRESSNRYDIYRGQYWGKYQIGKLVRKDLNVSISRAQFLRSPSVQEKVIVDLLKKNLGYLRANLDVYSGSQIGGIDINMSSLLAAAHLGGQYSVKLFLNSNGERVRRDGNGVPITDYMEQFAKYGDFDAEIFDYYISRLDF